MSTVKPTVYDLLEGVPRRTRGQRTFDAVLISLILANVEELVEQRRQELFISRSEAKSVIANCIEESQRQINFCPNCGSKLPGSRTA